MAVFNSTASAELLKWFVMLCWKLVLWAMGTEENVEAKSLHLAYLYKIIKVLKMLGSVIQFNVCPTAVAL